MMEIETNRFIFQLKAYYRPLTTYNSTDAIYRVSTIYDLRLKKAYRPLTTYDLRLYIRDSQREYHRGYLTRLKDRDRGLQYPIARVEPFQR